MNYYNQGGLADIAQNLANKGRNGDTKLVHMSPKEVRGLQTLAKANGTSLTINPDTGLPEAFRLENLIPMVAGAALSPFITPMGAAALVGGVYGASTGSIEKGLMAGIGAYGGAGLTEGLTSAASQGAVETSATNALGVPASTPTPTLTSTEFIPTDPYLNSVPVTPVTTSAPSQASILSAQNASIGLTPMQSAANISSSGGYAAGATPMPMSSQAMNLGSSGIENIFTKEGLTAAYKGMPMGTLPALGTTALMASQQTPNVPGYQEDEYDRRLKGYRLSPNYQPYQAPTPNPYYRPSYAAAGGVMNSYDDEAGMDMAGGGIASLGGYSDGGRMLKGPGDGMSDSIPGVIGGKQPARLADGEFVVPADVVSHLGNGSTDAGAKRLYSMMDKIRQARTGKKKQAPEVNAEKYLPVKTAASGGIAGYASGGMVGYATGGEIAAAYESVLGRAPDPAGAAYWASTGLSAGEIAKALAASPEARPSQVQQIFNQQFGRGAEQTAVDFYSKALASGQSLADVSKGIAQSKEGQKMDIQAATSAYRQALGRNPEPAGLQYWMSVAQSKGLTSDQLKNEITKAAVAEQTKMGIIKPFDNMQLAALESDPLAGYYSDYDIYDVAPDAENVSMIDGRRAQFTTPVTRQAIVSNFINGVYSTTPSKETTYTTTPGKDILNMPHVQAAINVARANGTLNEADYSSLAATLNTAKTPDDIRAAFNKPQGQVVIDTIQGQQIGEAKTLADARAEGALRQPILTAQMAQNPGTYLSNQILTDAYKAGNVSIPADYSFYQGVDTRDRTSNLLTPQNFQQRQNELVNTLNRNDPYRTSYQPINRGIANMPPSVQDPYSDAGLQFLYKNMMDQYGPPPAGFVNPATFVSNRPYTYVPPPVNNLVLNTPVADAVVAQANQAKADAAQAAQAATTGSSGDGGRAGGLMSIDRKKRAKYKT